MQLDEARQTLRGLPLTNDWHACTAAQELALAAQLEREIGVGHALHGRACIALAQRGSCDDVLYFVPGLQPSFAVVRLTWQVPRPARAFTWSQPFASLTDWAAAMAAPPQRA